MKNLKAHKFDKQNCRTEWTAFDSLLNSKVTLSESKDVLPFFKKSADLSLLTSFYFPRILDPDRYAHEFEIYGDFVADLIVGNFSQERYVLVEFEDGEPDSVFKQGKKATPNWAKRFEAAYSQIVDWLWKLDDMRQTNDFKNTFGSSQAKFQTLIVIGKGTALAAQEEGRLKWRMDKTLIDSNAISVVSFDQIRDDMDHWLTTYHKV